MYSGEDSSDQHVPSSIMSWVQILRFFVGFLFTHPGAEDLRQLDLDTAGDFSFSGSTSRIGSTSSNFSGSLAVIYQSTLNTTSSRDVSKRSSGTGAVSNTITPFWLGKDSLIRAAVAPEVNLLQPCSLWNIFS